MDKSIPHNYFTGEGTVSMSATLGEAEVMYSANANVKNLASSGSLKDLHNRCSELNETSEQMHKSTKEKLWNIIYASQAKENEIYEDVIENYEVNGIRLHDKHGWHSIHDILSLAVSGATK